MVRRGEIATTSLPLRDTKVDIASSSSSSNSSANSEGSDTKRSVYSICVTGLDLVNHILIACLTVFTLYHCLPSTSVFNLHVTLCTLGYVLLMSEAILILAGESILTNFLTHRAKKHLHWILQVLGVACTVSGVVLMFRVKQVHFRSTHAILGITSVSVMLILTIFGYPVFTLRFRNVIRPVVMKFGHNLLGMLCFTIGIASQCYGYRKFRSLSEETQTTCIVVALIIVALSLRQAFFKGVATIFRGTLCRN
ncbi:Probable transmembrane reductase CYB561D1 [Anthophora quadrimaculata]